MIKIEPLVANNNRYQRGVTDRIEKMYQMRAMADKMADSGQ